MMTVTREWVRQVPTAALTTGDPVYVPWFTAGTRIGGHEKRTVKFANGTPSYSDNTGAIHIGLTVLVPNDWYPKGRRQRLTLRLCGEHRAFISDVPCPWNESVEASA